MPDSGAADAVRDACQALQHSGVDAAKAVVTSRYPFNPAERVKRTYGPREALQVFVRDGFVDRYSGKRLVLPPVLDILHLRMPTEFPWHPNWRTDLTHAAFNELAATVDHVVPVTLGGADAIDNWVTTSMARNFAKSNFRLEELGWSLHPAGDVRVWDGMLVWFVEYAQENPDVAKAPRIRKWLLPARAARTQ